MFLYDALAVTHIITLHPVRAEGLVSSHNTGLTEFKCVLLYLSVISAGCLVVELVFPACWKLYAWFNSCARALFYACLICTTAPCPLWRLPRHRIGAEAPTNFPKPWRSLGAWHSVILLLNTDSLAVVCSCGWDWDYAENSDRCGWKMSSHREEVTAQLVLLCCFFY